MIPYLKTIMLGYTIEQVNAILGEPLEIRHYYSEIDDENWKAYNYSGNLFYFNKGKLIEFELKNNKLFFYDTDLQVGKGISSLAESFPLSYLKRGVSGGIGFATINIAMPDGTIADYFISVQYSPNTNIITSIGTTSN